MAIFDINGQELTSVYSIDGVELETAYDLNGDEIFSKVPSDEITYHEMRNAVTGTTYYVTHIPKAKSNGQKRIPFVYAPNGTGAATQSTLQMNTDKGFEMAINAGIFDMTTSSYTPIGTVIENGQVIQQGDSANMSAFNANLMVLTIDEDGNLSYANVNDSASDMIQNGIVSAVHSFVPIVINSQDATNFIENSYLTNTADAQRQIFGQYPNGDYCVITCEGRGYKNSVGFTIPQARQMCLDLGLKFAFNLDGGGSTETVIGANQINTIYEGTYGRKVPTYIVFNGTDTFGTPQ